LHFPFLAATNNHRLSSTNRSTAFKMGLPSIALLLLPVLICTASCATNDTLSSGGIYYLVDCIGYNDALRAGQTTLESWEIPTVAYYPVKPAEGVPTSPYTSCQDFSEPGFGVWHNGIKQECNVSTYNVITTGVIAPTLFSVQLAANATESAVGDIVGSAVTGGVSYDCVKEANQTLYYARNTVCRGSFSCTL
jgi:hypothetical protein